MLFPSLQRGTTAAGSSGGGVCTSNRSTSPTKTLTTKIKFLLLYQLDLSYPFVQFQYSAEKNLKQKIRPASDIPKRRSHLSHSPFQGRQLPNATDVGHQHSFTSFYRHLPFAIRHSPFAIRHSPLAIGADVF